MYRNGGHTEIPNTYDRAQLHFGSGTLNLGLHMCMASTLPMALSPQPMYNLFKAAQAAWKVCPRLSTRTVSSNVWAVTSGKTLTYVQHLNKYSALSLKTKDLKLLKKIGAVFPSKKKKIRNSMGKI